MMMRNLILVAALTGCAGTQAASHNYAAATNCGSLTEADRELASSETLQRVDRVAPYKLHDMRTRATQQVTYTAGARLYLPAQKGWSAPYLQRVLSCHAASGNASHANDPFDVQGIKQVTVAPHGTRYEITIAGTTREAGQQIWQRAQSIENGHVEVRQLSQADTTPAL